MLDKYLNRWLMSLLRIFHHFTLFHHVSCPRKPRLPTSSFVERVNSSRSFFASPPTIPRVSTRTSAIAWLWIGPTWSKYRWILMEILAFGTSFRNKSSCLNSIKRNNKHTYRTINKWSNTEHDDLKYANAWSRWLLLKKCNYDYDDCDQHYVDSMILSAKFNPRLKLPIIKVS